MQSQDGPFLARRTASAHVKYGLGGWAGPGEKGQESPTRTHKISVKLDLINLGVYQSHPERLRLINLQLISMHFILDISLYTNYRNHGRLITFVKIGTASERTGTVGSALLGRCGSLDNHVKAS